MLSRFGIPSSGCGAFGERGAEERRRPHRGRAILPLRQALLCRRPRHDDAIGHHARQHRPRRPGGEPVRRGDFFFVFYIVDASDGCASFNLVEMEDNAS